MADEIYVKVIPGCPVRVVCDDEEERAKVEEALADDCGCIVEVEAAAEEVVAEELVGAALEEAAAEVAEEAEEAKEELTCSLEPDKPWEESVCGVVAKEAGRQAAEDVMSRIRPIIQRMKVSEESAE